MDISAFMSWFISEMSSLATWCYSTLDSITFGGISLLDYIITILVLGVLIPLLINLVTVRSRSGTKEARPKSKTGSGIPDDV